MHSRNGSNLLPGYGGMQLHLPSTPQAAGRTLGASSRAEFCVRESTAALLTEYAGAPGTARFAAMLEILTTDPFELSRYGMASWVR